MPRAAEDTPLSDVIVDDSETDKIQYVPGTSTSGGDGKWTHASLTGEDFYYRGTLSSCSTQGCRLEFPFKGTAIAAYGVTSTMDNTSTWWQVDDGNIYVFEPSREGLDRTYHVRFYQSDALSFGDHTLYANITYLQGGMLQLDWIEYNTTANSNSTTSSSTSLSSTSATSSSSGSLSSTTAAPDSGTSRSGSSVPNKAIIIGCVVGGVVIIALLYGLYRLWRKRRSEGHARRLDNREDSPPPSFSILYDADADEESDSSHRPRYSSDTGLSASMAERQPMLSASQPAGEVPIATRLSDLNGRTSSTEQDHSHSVSGKGPLLSEACTNGAAGDGSDELPPAYSP
ncbi:hypothetical protein L227DRAFT_579661 [Lentinus tigrinus ALCF2SS1-6]|uniref:Mid2 domain-containing protein n=1 Tax=Lentinus tigrinus ALCF2SS1-6 TaxID=1328759 RepID=A0A5C2RX69_9APHY|nr:hypothetical protein L227DRAFT_579661 [Lentinus tigrinus ALCF2SS1-6]